jgi:hypothetical protein
VCLCVVATPLWTHATPRKDVGVVSELAKMCAAPRKRSVIAHLLACTCNPFPRAQIRVDFPAVDGMRLAGVGLPLSVPAPALPPILVVDASVLDGHYNLMVMVEVVEAAEPLEGGDLPLASPVLPGRYCLFVDSLWPKCKAVWKVCASERMCVVVVGILIVGYKPHIHE